MTNKIINENGSYLNQHEDNTVDWLICNKESLKKAKKKEDKNEKLKEKEERDRKSVV